jgi:hypothetical protein
MIKRFVIAAAIAASLIGAAAVAEAGPYHTCTTNCYGNTCTRTCY